MGHLYGYFSTDPTYPEGVRCNIEAVYDPPQIGDQHGVQELDDANIHKVDMIASALGLERVGIMFTSNEQDIFLSADDIRRSAKLQQQYSFMHNSVKTNVPKFVTIVARKKGEEDQVDLEAYMISDQGQALERDNVFGPSKDKKMMTLRVPGDDDLVPTVLTKGTDVKEFPPDFFLVSLAYGQPADTTDHSILKIHEFPVMNRESPATPMEFSGYLKKYASDPSEK